MAFLTLKNISIKGIAAAVPEFVESNYNYDWISLAEREMLVKTTGISNRHVAPAGLCTSDMCYAAAYKLLDDLHVNRDEIEILIFVSQSPDYFLPATSIILQNKLSLKKETIAFDVMLGCSGYTYGLSIIGSMMSSGKYKKGLLLVGDKSTFSVSEFDKSTYPIFGDAGTATLLEFDNEADPIDFSLNSDGSGFQSIIIPEGGVRNPWNLDSDKRIKIEEGIERSGRNLVLDGLEVFNFSLREVAPDIKKLLKYNQTEIEDYDFFVFHQANKLMIESIRKKLKVPPEKVPYSLNEFGNTSSASIPLTIVSNLGRGLIDRKLKLMISGFGVGLSWGSVSLTLNQVYCPEVIYLP